MTEREREAGMLPAVATSTAILWEWEPFLAPNGVAHCWIPLSGTSERLLLPLKDPRVKDLLFYCHVKTNDGELPNRSVLENAISIVHGQLWREHTPQAIKGSLVVRALQRAAETHESWVGSAMELLDLLHAIVRANPDLADAKSSSTPRDELPASPDALGILLSKEQVYMRRFGIILYRPSRRDRKRLWAWEATTFAPDAHDTSDDHASVATPSTNPSRQHDDTNDTFTESQCDLMRIYQKENHS